MFNIGGGEVLVIALIALVVIGPEQLPGVLRKVGQYTAQVKSMTNGIRSEFMSGVDDLDPTKWGSGSPDKPVVPRGYSDRKAAGEPDNPFASGERSSRSIDEKPVTAKMADADPDVAADDQDPVAPQMEVEPDENDPT